MQMRRYRQIQNLTQSNLISFCVPLSATTNSFLVAVADADTATDTARDTETDTDPEADTDAYANCINK